MIAIVFSIILYFAGLFSGLSFSKFVEQRTEAEITQLVDYVDHLDGELQSLQLQERFLSSLNTEESCKFSDDYFSQINQDLSYYWSILPSRLEAYEKNNKPTDEYLALKEDYTRLSLRAWIIAQGNFEKCDSDTIPALYFYSDSCPDCVKQGESLDDAKDWLAEDGKRLVVFTVDFNYKEPTLDLVKKYYNITSVPAIVVNGQVLQGRLIPQRELLSSIGDERALSYGDSR